VVKPPRFLPMVDHFLFAGDQAHGDWMMYLSSDDYLYPHCVETLANHIPADDSTVLVYGELASVDFRDLNDVRFYYNRKPTGLRTPGQSLRELLRQRPFFSWIPGGIMRQDAYQHCRELMDGRMTFGFDIAMLLKIHEIGSLFYVDELVGKFRIWSAQDGKVDAKRLLKNIQDANVYIRLVEESPVLRSLLGPTDLADWRTHQARRWEMAALLDFFTGGSSSAETGDAIHAVGRHIAPPNGFTHFISWLSNRPQAALTRPVLSGLYRLYLSVQKLAKRPF
jgi:hypothetical protein